MQTQPITKFGEDDPFRIRSKSVGVRLTRRTSMNLHVAFSPRELSFGGELAFQCPVAYLLRASVDAALGPLWVWFELERDALRSQRGLLTGLGDWVRGRAPLPDWARTVAGVTAGVWVGLGAGDIAARRWDGVAIALVQVVVMLACATGALDKKDAPR